MKRKILNLILLIILSGLVVIPASAAPFLAEEQTKNRIIYLINEYRGEQGMAAYLFNPILGVVAQDHTDYQASIGESTHSGEGRTTSTDRGEAGGYGGDNRIFMNEMIYHGLFATPEKAVAWWKNSPIHNAIMLSDDYHEIGVGVAQTETYIYYTVNVGRVIGVTAPGVGSDTTIPSEEEVPVEAAGAGDDGSIYHLVVGGQTIEGIASAYQVSVDDLLVLNRLVLETELANGQLLVIQLPIETAAPTETPIPSEIPDEVEEIVIPSESPDTPTEEPASTAVVAPVEAGTDEQVSESGALKWVMIVLAGGLVLVGLVFAGVSFFRLKEEVEDDDEGDENDGHSEFEHRSRQEQFAILQEVAELAFDAYPLELLTIEPLRYVLNAEFLVKVKQSGPSDAAEQYVVRVNAPGFQTKVEIGSECDWLYGIHQDTDLNVPRPLRTQAGEWVETINYALVGEERHCVVFEYIPGHTIEMEATTDHFEIVGALVARLHQHGAVFDPPQGFVRKHWDMEGLTGEMLDVPAEKAYRALSEHELTIVKAAEKITASAMDRLGKNDNIYGLIHADLHMKSFLFYEGKPLILDFDTCGYGYYVYDLAVVIWNMFDRPDFSSLKGALLRGYRSERLFSEEEEQLLIHFVAGRLMTQILAWAARRDDHALAGAANQAIKQQVEQLEILIRMLVD